MTDVFSLAGVALCSLCAVLTVREVRRDFTPYLLMGTAVIFLLACLPGIGEGIRFAGTLTAAAGEGTVSVVLRALGVSWMTAAAGEICEEIRLEKALAAELSIPVSTEYYNCPGSFLFMHRGRPDQGDLTAVAAFAKRTAERCAK